MKTNYEMFKSLDEKVSSLEDELYEELDRLYGLSEINSSDVDPLSDKWALGQRINHRVVSTIHDFMVYGYTRNFVSNLNRIESAKKVYDAYAEESE